MNSNSNFMFFDFEFVIDSFEYAPTPTPSLCDSCNHVDIGISIDDDNAKKNILCQESGCGMCWDCIRLSCNTIAV